VLPLIGVSVQTGARHLGHLVSWIVTLVVMIALFVYLLYGSRERWGSHWQKFGPTYLVAVASVFVMADPTRHVLKDWKVLTAKWSNMYIAGCGAESWRCLTWSGVMFSICFTYFGFLLLIWGTMWNANIIDKLRDIKDKWTEIRSTRREDSEFEAV